LEEAKGDVSECGELRIPEVQVVKITLHGIHTDERVPRNVAEEQGEVHYVIHEVSICKL